MKKLSAIQKLVLQMFENNVSEGANVPLILEIATIALRRSSARLVSESL
jgi:hypothetical protein